MSHFTTSLVDYLIAKPEVRVTVSAKAWRANEISKTAFCINYHKTFRRKRNLNVKAAYLPDYFYADPKGYSGWSDIANRTFDGDTIHPEDAITYFNTRLKTPYLDKGRSKYFQPTCVQDLPKDYVFFPMQVPGDAVLDLCYFKQEALLYKLIRGAKKRPVVIKLHPLTRRDLPEAARDVDALHDPKNGVFVVDGHLHDLIRGAHVTVCSNSGAGLEALLLGCPVITCAKVDYHHLTVDASRADMLPDLIDAAKPHDDLTIARYAKWLFGDQFIDIRDPVDVWGEEVFQRLLIS